MGMLQALRKAYWAIKDQVFPAYVAYFKDLDVTILMATNHVKSPPEERHLTKIKVATSSTRPRADVAYCIRALSSRMEKTHNWTVALKSLIVIHRTMQEGDPVFIEELRNIGQKNIYLHILIFFKDDSSRIALDCTEWVRRYGRFLERRIRWFQILKYDIEADCFPRTGQGEDRGYTKDRHLESEVLFDKLSTLHELLFLLTTCRPAGEALGFYIVQYALALVLKESFKLYCSMNDWIINLVDKFFEMPRHEATKALRIYKTAMRRADELSNFYEFCERLEHINFEAPVLREPPPSFLVTMEEYVNDVPRMVPDPSVALEFGTPTLEPLPRTVPAASCRVTDFLV